MDYLCCGVRVPGKCAPFFFNVTTYHAAIVEEGVWVTSSKNKVHRICFCHCQGCKFDLVRSIGDQWWRTSSGIGWTWMGNSEIIVSDVP